MTCKIIYGIIRPWQGACAQAFGTSDELPASDFSTEGKEPLRILRTEQSTMTQAALNILPEGCSENRMDYDPGIVPGLVLLLSGTPSGFFDA